MLANHELDLLKEYVAAQNRMATVLEALLTTLSPEAAARLHAIPAAPPPPPPPAVGGGIAQPLAAPGRQAPAQPAPPAPPPIQAAAPPQAPPPAPRIPPGPAAAMGHGMPQGATPSQALLEQMAASGLPASVHEGAPQHIGPGDLQEPQRRGFGAQPPAPGAPAVRPAPGTVQPGPNGGQHYVPPPGPYAPQGAPQAQAQAQPQTQAQAPQGQYIPQRPPDVVSQTPGRPKRPRKKAAKKRSRKKT